MKYSSFISVLRDKLYLFLYIKLALFVSQGVADSILLNRDCNDFDINEIVFDRKMTVLVVQ